METIKTAATMGVVDFRRTLRVIVNTETGAERRMSLADFEDRICSIPMSASAPETVQDLIVTAKNLLLYSWYYYPFGVTAALQSMIAVEGALKIRLAAKPRDSLSYLLKKAIDQGLITNAGFPRWKAYRESFQEFYSFPVSDANLTQVLLDTLPEFRNTIAHGNRFLDDMGFHQLDIACEVIDQLYPQINP